MAAQTGGQVLTDPWPAYFGGHDGPEVWSGVVRGIGRAQMQSLAYSATNDAEEIMLEVADRVAEVVALDQDAVMPIGGLSSGRNQDIVNGFMDTIERDGGASYKDLVRLKARIIGAVPGARQAVYWQVGNEINSKHYANSLHTWVGLPELNKPNDSFVIPFYVEYFLAPTVEAIEDVSVELFGSSGQINIMLGSLVRTNGGGMDWSEQLLNYQIQGDFAPSLAGKRVYELVDIVSVHYVVSKASAQWRNTVDALAGNWMGVGRVRGIWSTEESGKSAGDTGKGAGKGIRVGFRYLDWWSLNGFSSTEGRAIFWGSNIETAPGTSVSEAMTTVATFLGNQRLVRLAPETIDGAGKNEVYGFDTEDNSKRVVAVFAESRRNSGTIDTLTMPAGSLAFTGTAEAHVFTVMGHTVVDVDVQRSGDNLVLVPAQPIAVTTSDMAVLFTVGR